MIGRSHPGSATLASSDHTACPQAVGQGMPVGRLGCGHRYSSDMSGSRNYSDTCDKWGLSSTAPRRPCGEDHDADAGDPSATISPPAEGGWSSLAHPGGTAAWSSRPHRREPPGPALPSCLRRRHASPGHDRHWHRRDGGCRGQQRGVRPGGVSAGGWVPPGRAPARPGVGVGTGGTGAVQPKLAAGAVLVGVAGAGTGRAGTRTRAASPGPSGSGLTGRGLPGVAASSARPRRRARKRRKDSIKPVDVDMLLSP